MTIEPMEPPRARTPLRSWLCVLLAALATVARPGRAAA